MNARAALFDVYGDHLRARGGLAPVAALVRLLGALDIAAPAVRTAVSRMVRQGWLAPAATGSGPGYRLTPRAAQRLDEAAERIYRSAPTSWDGKWDVLVVDRVPDRARRERLRDGLSFLGYATVRDSVWIAARPSVEVEPLLATEGVTAERFSASYQGRAAGLVARVWDLEAIGRSYQRWLDETAGRLVLVEPPDDEAAFAVRSRLVHEWRKFLFRDPGLPQPLLPAGWPGDKARRWFAEESARLLPAATRFVDACLQAPRTRRPAGGHGE